jgi:hypothetical protein
MAARPGTSDWRITSSFLERIETKISTFPPEENVLYGHDDVIFWSEHIW